MVAIVLTIIFSSSEMDTQVSTIPSTTERVVSAKNKFEKLIFLHRNMGAKNNLY